MYICMCNAVTDEELEDTVEQHPAKTDSEIMDILNISKGCGVCKDLCCRVLDDIRRPIDLPPDEEFYEDSTLSG